MPTTELDADNDANASYAGYGRIGRMQFKNEYDQLASDLTLLAFEEIEFNAVSSVDDLRVLDDILNDDDTAATSGQTQYETETDAFDEMINAANDLALQFQE